LKAIKHHRCLDELGFAQDGLSHHNGPFLYKTLMNLKRIEDGKIFLGSLVNSLFLMASCYLRVMGLLAFHLVLQYSPMFVVLLVLFLSPFLFPRI